MSGKAYSEDQLVEVPAAELLRELSWTTRSASEETLGSSGALQRDSRGHVVPLERLRAALTKLNPTLPPEALAAAIDELTRDRGAMVPAAANREVYLLQKDGIKVSVPDRERGGEKTERVRLIDWENPAANEFLAVRQITYKGPLCSQGGTGHHSYV